MITIRGGLSFRDSVGRIYRTDQILVRLRGDAAVYSLKDEEQYLFVRFSGVDDPPESMIRTMCDSSCDELAKANVLWPDRVCYQLEDDMFCGFLAKKIHISPDMMSLEQWMQPENFGMLPASQRPVLGYHLGRCIHGAHQALKGYCLGTFQPDDFHGSADGRVIYCYAYRHMDNCVPGAGIYGAPECRMMERRPSAASDAFSYAMILFRLLTGALPFGSHQQQICDNEELVDMILNGESIYYYASCPQSVALDQAVSSVSPELSVLFRLCFDYCGRNQYDDKRPSMEDWLDALKKALQEPNSVHEQQN